MRNDGLTLVEMLIAMAIFAVILTVISTYFTSQLRFSQLVQARAEVQDKVKFLMTVTTQDLQLAGVSRYVAEDASRNPSAIQNVGSFSACTAANPCISGTSSGVKDTLTARYVTSLRPLAESCRSVAYGFTTGGMLQRSDVKCGDVEARQDLASGVLAFNLLYICSDGAQKDTPVCPSGTFTRAARISIYAQSEAAVRTGGSSSFTVEGTAIDCPSDRVCFGMQQEVAMPNLKDK